MTPDLRSLAAAAATLEAHAPARHSLALALHGDRYEVRSDDASLIAELRGYFAPFLAPDSDAAADVRILAYQAPAFPADTVTWTIPPEERKRKRKKERYIDLPDGRVVHKVRTGMMFGFGGDLNIAFGPCTDNPNQVVNFVNNRLMSRALDEGAILAHAAAVSMRGRAVAFAGFSGMGKSTTALHLMNVPGTVFVSNDRLLLSRGANGDVRAAGVPKHPRINPGTALHNDALARIVAPEKAAALRQMAPDALWALEDKYDAIVDDCFGPGRFELRASLAAFIVLNWGPPGAPMRATRTDLDERPALLPAIMKGPGLFHHPGAPLVLPAADSYHALLAGVPLYELTGGADFAGAVALSRRILDGEDVHS